MNEKNLNHMLTKFSSGRWILTVIGGVVFAYSAYKGTLSAEATASILMMIFVSYFQKKSNRKE